MGLLSVLAAGAKTLGVTAYAAASLYANITSFNEDAADVFPSGSISSSFSESITDIQPDNPDLGELIQTCITEPIEEGAEMEKKKDDMEEAANSSTANEVTTSAPPHPTEDNTPQYHVSTGPLTDEEAEEWRDMENNTPSNEQLEKIEYSEGITAADSEGYSSRTDKEKGITYHTSTASLSDEEKAEWAELEANTIDEKYLQRATDESGNRITGEAAQKEEWKSPIANQENSKGEFFPDGWKEDHIPQGTKLYQISADGDTKSSYFTDAQTVDQCRNEDGSVDMDKLKGNLQISDPHNEKNRLDEYTVNNPDGLDAASGKALANGDYGDGNGNQYFIPNASELKANGNLKRTSSAEGEDNNQPIDKKDNIENNSKDKNESKDEKQDKGLTKNDDVSDNKDNPKYDSNGVKDNGDTDKHRDNDSKKTPEYGNDVKSDNEKSPNDHSSDAGEASAGKNAPKEDKGPEKGKTSNENPTVPDKTPTDSGGSESLDEGITR